MPRHGGHLEPITILFLYHLADIGKVKPSESKEPHGTKESTPMEAETSKSLDDPKGEATEIETELVSPGTTEGALKTEVPAATAEGTVKTEALAK